MCATLALIAAVLLAGLSLATAHADPDPNSGKLVLVLDSSGSMKEPAGDGRTKIVAAAKDLGPDGKRTIVLVSDGKATCAPEPCEVARSIANQGIDLKIDVVGFRVGAKARSQLQCVAREGRGNHYDADSTTDLEAGLDRARSATGPRGDRTDS